MAKLGTTFQATEHDTEQREFENLPSGIYQLEISASEVKPTSSGNGTILTTVVDVVAPEELKGRKLFGNNYNLENSNPTAQEIGQRQFASLCRAIGVDSVDDSEELHFRVFTAKIGMGKDSKERNADGTPKYAGRAEIKRYYFPDSDDIPDPAIDENQPAPAARQTAANDNRRAPANDNRQSSQPAKAAGSRPWGKK